MKRYFPALIFAALVIALALAANAKAPERAVIKASLAAESDEQTDIPQSVDELLEKLELSGVQGILDALDSKSLAVFGFSDIKERIRAVSDGEYENGYSDIFTYVLGLVGADITKYVPMLLSLVAIAIAYGMVNSLKGRFASDAIEKAVYFATSTVAVSLVIGYFASALVGAVRLVASVKTQVNAVAPVLLTLMTATGARSSAGVFGPTVALLGDGMTNAVTYIVFPALLMGLVFDVISTGSAVSTHKAAEFFRSVAKWFLGTAFFLFIAVIGVSGITASVRDGISVRAARFAVSKYVPVIGGYLSQGFDFVLAGNVLIKNALGVSAVVLIVLTAAPAIASLAVFTLSLRLTAAIIEPIGGEKLCGMLSAVAKSSSMIATVAVAMTFLYIIFLSMLICTGNIAL